MSTRSLRIAASAIALLVGTGTVMVHRTASAVINETILMSKAGGFGPKGNANSLEPKFSADGRFVAFRSAATNLHPDDTDGHNHIFLREPASDTTALVSRAGGPAGAKGNTSSFEPAISADGRFVAFRSAATNLHPDDSDVTIDIFLRDVVADTTTLISRASGAAGVKGNGNSFDPSVSADGRFVAFSSSAANLHPDDLDTTQDVFVRDVVSGTTTLVSRAGGAAGDKGNGSSNEPSISADGRFIAFTSFASNLHADDTDTIFDLFLRDLASDSTTLVSRAGGADGTKGNDESFEPAISADGRFVAFYSIADNLHPDDIDDDDDVFVRDIASETITLVSRADGAAGVKGASSSLAPSISADGRFVAFYSQANNLHPDDPDTTFDVFVRDVSSDTTTLISRATGAAGVKGNFASFRPSMPADGRFVAFLSSASNLHPDDPDSVQDIFARDVLGPQPPPALSIGNVKAKEGKSGTKQFTFKVLLRGTPSSTVSVDFATLDGTATVAGNDYLPSNGTLVFPPWLHEQTIVVDVQGDKKKEKTETFSVLLFNASGVDISDETGVGKIVNDDKKRPK